MKSYKKAVIESLTHFLCHKLTLKARIKRDELILENVLAVESSRTQAVVYAIRFQHWIAKNDSTSK